MKPIDFVKIYLPAARQAEAETKISYLISLAQAALESAWGDHAPGFNFFGMKDSDGINGNEQLIPTFECSKYPHLQPKQVGLDTIDRIEWSESRKCFVYYGKGYFRKYESAIESFEHHARLFFMHNKAGIQLYASALPYLNDPYRFVDIISPIYASGTGYADLVHSIMNSVKKIVTDYNL